MSIRVMNHVWQTSRSKNGARLVLLALADFADNGGGAYPSVAAICAKTLLTDRSVQAGLKELMELGELSVKPNAARKGCNYYIINVTPEISSGAKNLPPEDIAPPKILPNTPEDSSGEPSVEPSELSEAKASSSAAEPTDPVRYEQVAGLFHQLCPSLPKLRDTPEHRKRAIRCRWKATNGHALERFEELFRLAQASDFLSGRNGQWSGCSFDWLLKPANAQKVLEGNYNNDRQKPNGTHRKNPTVQPSRNDGTLNAGTSGQYAGHTIVDDR